MAVPLVTSRGCLETCAYAHAQNLAISRHTDFKPPKMAEEGPRISEEDRIAEAREAMKSKNDTEFALYILYI